VLLYAPEFLRRRRRTLVPALGAVGLISFAALALAPSFGDAPAPNALAMLAAAIAVPLLVVLLNGDPLPHAESFVPVRLEAGSAVDFVARFSEASASRAQSDFWLRSVRELRLGSILAMPLCLAFATVILAKFGADAQTVFFFMVFTLLAFASPLLSLIKSKRLARSQARFQPERVLRVANEGIGAGSSEEGLAWSNVARVWEFEDHLTLVLHPMMAIQIPKKDIPADALAIIAAAAPPSS
jgi:hypothetical protein